MITVTTYPRLHFGLIDLGGDTMRSYGGCGAVFEGPPVKVRGSMSRSLEFGLAAGTDLGELGLEALIADLSSAGLRTRGSYELMTAPESHVGLGSTTATSLALLTCMSELNGWRLGRAELIDLSGRGRTSAVGCNGFFDGGFIVDAGQPGHPDAREYRPSIDGHGRLPSLHIGSWLMPDHWRVTILNGGLAPTVLPERERELFRVPGAAQHSLRAVASLYHGILPAILESDIAALALALARLQATGLKRIEILMQPQGVQELLGRLWRAGYAAGLSSFGPTVFVITTSEYQRARLASEFEVDLGPTYAFRNRGAEVREE